MKRTTFYIPEVLSNRLTETGITNKSEYVVKLMLNDLEAKGDFSIRDEVEEEKSNEEPENI